MGVENIFYNLMHVVPDFGSNEEGDNINKFVIVFESK